MNFKSKKVKVLTRIVFIITIVMGLLYPDFTYSQFNNLDCGFVSSPAPNYLGTFTGLYKPIRTDLSGDSTVDAYFPVLVVCVQFKDDNNYPDWWPSGQAPIFIDSMISPIKRTNTNWWEAYDSKKEPISSFWMEASKGKLHVVGKAFSVVLDSTASYYGQFGSTTAELMINEEIWNKLKSPSLGINWQDYDKWKDSVVNNEHKFFYRPDGYVDMIFKIHKSTGGVLFDKSGYACLAAYNAGTNYLIDSTNMIYINYGYGNLGSGFTVCRLGEKTRILLTATHEYSHFLFANGHITYGKITYGPGSEAFLSPYETMLLDYSSYVTTDLSTTNSYTIGDYAGRNTNYNTILKIPIQGEESFLIANRGNYSKWDKMMSGDTARVLGPELQTTYGRGVYIYHVKNGIHAPNGDEHVQDLECADGLWHFYYAGRYNYRAYDAGWCWNGGLWEVYERDSPRYDNDNGWNDSVSSVGDGKSFFRPLWAWKGKIPEDPCQPAIERTFTNSKDYISFDESAGDRWDPWNKDYNEIFSPYSSPSTNTWNTFPTNQNSGIYIWLNSYDNKRNLASMRIYRVGYNGMTDSSILRITPPARPMGIKVVEYYPTNNTWCNPRVEWHHNLEPDMLRNDNTKKYLVYRATQPDMNSVPGDYQLIATVYINKDSIPYYNDTTILNYDCALLDQVPPFGTAYPVRYKVKAEDIYGDNSVFSDFASAVGITPDGGVEDGGEDHFGNNDNLPKKFDLSQNFPNPFNPVTNIKYDLPKDIFVTVKIYDILGREIKTLVNEFKQAGRYLISFNGTEFASGIYFYRIQAGSFIQVKRMVLIK